jgi:superoxide reductase
MVEVVHAGGGELVCCGQPMVLLTENSVDASKEKHVPVVTQTATGTLIKVGAAPHPMEEKHYIEFVELIADGRVCRKFLKPGDGRSSSSAANRHSARRAYCNLRSSEQSQRLSCLSFIIIVFNCTLLL